MKRLFIPMMSLLLIFTNLYAQDEGRPQMLFSSGLTIPAGSEEFRELWNPGFNYAVGLDIYITYAWDFNISFEYNRFFLDEQKFKNAYEIEPENDVLGYDASVLFIGFNGKYILKEEGRNIPYLIFGFGIFKFSTDKREIYKEHRSIDTLLSESTYKLGLNTGIGIEIPLHLRFHLFGELKYSIGMTREITHLIPVKIGFKFK
ncbi:hypothetical protein ACFL6G_06725 [candidate division KSB1 bacterium]